MDYSGALKSSEVKKQTYILYGVFLGRNFQSFIINDEPG
jgi:hypothetical protein